MSENPFYRLAPFIQEYIYREQWSSLRQVQVDAIQAILDTQAHVLISSGTASGKTEAAMLPILTEIMHSPSATIGALYIGPLKALINDQFSRLHGLLEETEIPVQSWHGDVSQSKKKRFLQNAQGILQITPESMEAMLINRNGELGRLFGQLRYVVIDEVHAFIDSDRGRQVICQLERLMKYQTTAPRRIGLSATIGEPKLAMHWLTGSTGIEVKHIQEPSGGRTVELGLEHFLIDPDEDGEETSKSDEPNPETTEHIEGTDLLLAAAEPATELFEHIYSMSRRAHKTLIFANSRRVVEETSANLRGIASRNNDPDTFFVHHGSISASLRESAEEAMRNPDQPTCVTATVTLELGIDVGRLDQVLQINATNSVSSFVQRLGRSGRRETPAKMFFYSVEEAPPTNARVTDLIPWNLLQTIAIIQLYVEKKWVEPPAIPHLPFSLVYHQTMSVLKANTEMAPPKLAETVLTLSPFSGVTLDHYRALLQHLVNIEHLETMETGTLIIGRRAEPIVNNYRFYATFEDEVGYRVLHRSVEIGTIQGLPATDEVIALAGFAWRVREVNADNKVIHVERSRGKPRAVWLGGGPRIHTEVLRRMREVLSEDTKYPYLLGRATKRLSIARALARNTGMAQESLLHLGGDRYLFLPWVGSRPFTTLALLLDQNAFGVANSYAPYYMILQSNIQDTPSLLKSIANIADARIEPEQLIGNMKPEEFMMNKYDKFVPEVLLKEAFVRDVLDIPGAMQILSSLKVV